MTDTQTPFDLAQTDALLSTTRAVRLRLDLDRPVAREVIEECLELAAQAPIGSNVDTRRWVIVTEADLKEAIADLYRSESMDYLNAGVEQAERSGNKQQARVAASAKYLAENLERVPLMVIPCTEPKVDLSDNATAAGIYGSILPAVWSFQLALRSRGLGSTWTTLHLGAEERVSGLLGIPDTVTQVAMLPVAYTIGDQFRAAKRPPVSRNVHWNRWGQH